MTKKQTITYLKTLLADQKLSDNTWQYYSHDIELSGFFQPDNIHVWIARSSNYTIEAKQHHRYVIKFLLSGKTASYLDNHHLTLSPGEFFIIFPYQRHNELPPGPGEAWEMLCINFMEAPNSKFSLLPLKNRVFKPDKTEEVLIKNICKGSLDPALLSKIDTGMALAWLLARLMCKTEKKVEPPPQYTSLAEEITQYVSQNIDKKLTIKDLCSKFKVSATTLRRLFAAQKGNTDYNKTPGAFIRHLKLVRSGEWLLSGKNSLKEIAIFCGYSDQFAFSRAFKKINGYPPSKLRKKQ